MKGLIVSIFVFLVLISPVIALDINLDSDVKEVIYPNTKNAEITLSFNKGTFDKIVDMEYTLSISGSATFTDGTKEIAGSYPELDETKTIKQTLNFQDTSSSDKEYITLSLKGEYVANAVMGIGGGKKQMDETLQLSIISTDKGKVEEEKKEVEKEKAECEESLTTCNSEKSGLQSELTSCELTNSELKANNSGLQSDLDNYSCSNDTYKILGIPITIIIILVLIYFLYKKNKENDELRGKIHKQHHSQPQHRY